VPENIQFSFSWFFYTVKLHSLTYSVRGAYGISIPITKTSSPVSVLLCNIYVMGVAIYTTCFNIKNLCILPMWYVCLMPTILIERHQSPVFNRDALLLLWSHKWIFVLPFSKLQTFKNEVLRIKRSVVRNSNSHPTWRHGNVMTSLPKTHITDVAFTVHRSSPYSEI
jgi:hypothetical protein